MRYVVYRWCRPRTCPLDIMPYWKRNARVWERAKGKCDDDNGRDEAFRPAVETRSTYSLQR